jgi:hypothetical protein
MCYEFERAYWLLRAEEVRKEMRKKEEQLKQSRSAPAKPDVPAKDVGEQSPVPA